MIFPTIQWDREKALERHRALECIIKGIFPKEASEASERRHIHDTRSRAAKGNIRTQGSCRTQGGEECVVHK